MFFNCLTRVSAQSNYVDSLLKWIDDHPKKDSQYIITLHRLSYRYSENDVNKSFAYYEEVATLSDQLNFTYGKALAQLNLGILLYSAGDFTASNTANFKAVELSEACGAQRLEAISLNNIGENFRALKDYSKCREYTLQAIVKNRELKAWRGLAINYELLQKCDLKENKYSEAFKHLTQGMPFAEMANEGYILGLYYTGFGKIKALAGQTDSADYFFSKAQEIARNNGDKRNQFGVFIARVEYMPHLSDSKKLTYLKGAYDIASVTNYREGMVQAANLLSAFYDGRKNKDSSMFYFNIYRSNYDSIYSEKIRRSVIIKEADWMIERQELENHHLVELAKLNQGKITTRNYLLAGSFALLVLCIGIAFVIYRNIEGEKKSVESNLKRKIAETRMQALRAQMNPHFLFNSLNSIENFIMKNEKWAASDYLNKFSSLIRIILESSRVERVPFKKDFEAIKLYVELEQLRFNKKFTVKTSVPEELMNEDFTVPPLMIQPFVENAIIHGLSQSQTPTPELVIKVMLEEGYIFYVIEDNGIGREKSRELYKKNRVFKHGSMGLKVTQERIDILNLQQKNQAFILITDLYDDEKNPCGTRVQLKIKVA